MLPLKAHPLLRVLLAACVAALLLGDVWRSLHLLHARHVLCPEHGELVDADDALAGAGHTLRLAALGQEFNSRVAQFAMPASISLRRGGTSKNASKPARRDAP